MLWSRSLRSALIRLERTPGALDLDVGPALCGWWRPLPGVDAAVVHDALLRAAHVAPDATAAMLTRLATWPDLPETWVRGLLRLALDQTEALTALAEAAVRAHVDRLGGDAAPALDLLGRTTPPGDRTLCWSILGLETEAGPTGLIDGLWTPAAPGQEPTPRTVENLAATGRIGEALALARLLVHPERRDDGGLTRGLTPPDEGPGWFDTAHARLYAPCADGWQSILACPPDVAAAEGRAWRDGRAFVPTSGPIAASPITSLRWTEGTPNAPDAPECWEVQLGYGRIEVHAVDHHRAARAAWSAPVDALLTRLTTRPPPTGSAPPGAPIVRLILWSETGCAAHVFPVAAADRDPAWASLRAAVRAVADAGLG